MSSFIAAAVDGLTIVAVAPVAVLSDAFVPVGTSTDYTSSHLAATTLSLLIFLLVDANNFRIFVCACREWGFINDASGFADAFFAVAGVTWLRL